MAKKQSVSSSKRTSTSTTKMKSGGAKKSVKKYQTGGAKSYTMTDYISKYPENPSDTLARSNPQYAGTKYFDFAGTRQKDLEKAHSTKYGNYDTGYKAASPPLIGTKLENDYNSQQPDFKKGGSVKKKTTMKKST
jgi:hypothetical protein